MVKRNAHNFPLDLAMMFSSDLQFHWWLGIKINLLFEYKLYVKLLSIIHLLLINFHKYICLLVSLYLAQVCGLVCYQPLIN